MVSSLVFASNEPRAAPLLAALRRRIPETYDVPFDDIDLITRYVAALGSFTWPRAEWYRNYQMHPLVQKRRRRVLLRGIVERQLNPDALLMWGSWFKPWERDGNTPYFHYIDQSRALVPEHGEPGSPSRARIVSHRLQAEAYRDCAGIFCMSEWARRQTITAHPAVADRVHTVGWGPCAVDLSAEPPSTHQAERLVLHVSNDFRRKGVDYLSAVASRVRAELPATRFVVIGRDRSGWAPPVDGSVEFLGPIYDRSTLEKYFRRAAVFLLPHRFDRSPHVLVEAMSAGIPFVASDQGGATELAAQGAGVAVPVGDVEGYAAACLKFLREPAGARVAGRHGWELVRTRYNWNAVADRILALMNAALNPLRHSGSV